RSSANIQRKRRHGKGTSSNIAIHAGRATRISSPASNPWRMRWSGRRRLCLWWPTRPSCAFCTPTSWVCGV
ncbi:FBP26, partial [Symbiodinium sp. CCMP2456]